MSHALWLKLDSPSGSTSPCPLDFHTSTSVDASNGAKSGTDERIASTKALAEMAEEMKHGRAMSGYLRMPSLPERTGRLACVHDSLVSSMLIMSLKESLIVVSISSSRSVS